MGDFALKRYVIAEPHVSTHRLTDADAYIVVACDGLWDVMSDESVANMVLDSDDHAPCLNIAKQLIKEAIRRGTTDNVSVQVVRLKK